MKVAKLACLFHGVIGGAFALLASVSVVSAQSVLYIAQPDFNTVLPVTLWAWQSFTVNQESTMTSFAFEWNKTSSDLNATAKMELLSGEGTGGSVLATATGSVSPDLSGGPGYGYDIFAASFGGVDLAPGQYTVYVSNPTGFLQFVGTSYDSYRGGQFVGNALGGSSYDAAFFASSFYSPAIAPEPSSIALAITGFASWGCMGGFNALKRRSRKLSS